MGKKKQTVGYRYYLGMHSVFCQGPVDKVTHLYWDEDLAWTGDWVAGQIYIDKPSLFGGDDKEGGIQGVFDLHRGDELYANDYLVSQLGAGNVSAYYGTTAIVARSPYLGNSPYIKPMSAVIQAGEWQWPGMPQWNPSRLKIPYNAVFGSGGGTVGPGWNDEAFRQGLDVWIMFSGNTGTADGNDIIPMADAVRAAINQRINGLAAPHTPASKQVGLGIAHGGYAQYRTGSGDDRDESITSVLFSLYASTNIPATWDTWNTYDMTAARVRNQSNVFGGLDMFSGIFGNWSEPNGTPNLLAAAQEMGRDVSRRAVHRHGVVIYLGNSIEPSQFSFLASRYASVGGTFQVHKVRPVHFRRTVSPYDFFQSRVNRHIWNILDNQYPAGSDTQSIAFNDGIQLNANAVDGSKPSGMGYDVNPAHILRECIISPIIGLGEPENTIDAARAEYAANLLFNEGFGLSLKWSQESAVEEFMQTVCDHANITCYVSNLTGLWVIKPIRGDYNPATIPRLTEESDILEIETLTRRLPSEGINAVTIKFHDIDRNDNTSIPVYNTAAIQQKGGAIDATTVFYDGILREDLAYAVGERDLLTLGYPLVTGAIFLDRRNHYYEPGDVFRLDAPSYGVLNEVMRVVDVDYGNDEDQRIRVELSSDIYSLEPQPMERGEPYVPPQISQPPVPMMRKYVEEASYYLGIQEMGKALLDSALQADPDTGGIYVAGPSPAGSLASAQVWSRIIPSETWEQFLTMEFAPTVVLDGPLLQDPTDEEINYTVSWVPGDMRVGDVAVIESEYVRIKTISLSTRTITVARGVFDTVPVDHPPGSLLIVVSGFGGFISNNYTADMEFEVRLLPFSGNQVLDLANASPDGVVLRSRPIRPYPAADLRVNGEYLYSVEDWEGIYTFTWVHRNRMQQVHLAAGYTEGGLTPEAGLTYRFRVSAWRLDGTRLPNVVDIDIGLVDTYTVDLADYAIPLEASKVAAEIVAIRDGYENWTNVGLAYVTPFTMSMGLETLWWDVNVPTSMRQNADKTGLVNANAAPVRHIANIASRLPGGLDDPDA